jgi:signal transduction histidine kinase
MMAFPVWLTRRRQLTFAAVAIVGVAGIWWLHRRNERVFLSQFLEALPVSTALSADALSDWAALHAAQTRTLAAVASSSAAPPDVALSTVLPAMVAEGGWQEGHVRAAAGPVVPVSSRRVSDTLVVADFAAPIRRGDAVVGHVVLTMALHEATFSHFNVTSPEDRTQRTALLSLEGGTLTAIAVSRAGHHDDPPAMLRSRPPEIGRGAETQATYAKPLQESGARALRGIGIGLNGQQVGYATTQIPGTPWLLLRERDVGELLALVRPRFYFTDGIFGLILTLVLGVMLLRWRSLHLRREAAAMELRATFVASVSHELRTPLTQIRMYAEMWRLGLLDAPNDAARAVSIIEKEAERLTLLVERSLSFAKAGLPSRPVVTEPVSLDDAIPRAVAAIGAIAAERQVTIRTDVEPGLTAHIPRDDLHQVALNLLDNAIKYGPRGQTIDVRVSGNGTMVRLQVADEGPGIPATERQSIWKAFVRGNAATKTAAASTVHNDQHAPLIGGSGIGLAVVKDLVERAGGRATVESLPADALSASAGGALFVIELPRRRPADRTDT